jgi:anti-sigma B factor antagonist
MSDLPLYPDATAGADHELAREYNVTLVGAPPALIVGNRGEFKERVKKELERGPRGIVIDFSRTDYIDSSGLGVLFALGKEAKRLGVGYRLTGLNPDLRDLFALTKMDTVLRIAPTPRVAVLEASVCVPAGEMELPKSWSGDDESPPLRVER